MFCRARSCLRGKMSAGKCGKTSAGKLWHTQRARKTSKESTHIHRSDQGAAASTAVSVGCLCRFVHSFGTSYILHTILGTWLYCVLCTWRVFCLLCGGRGRGAAQSPQSSVPWTMDLSFCHGSSRGAIAVGCIILRHCSLVRCLLLLEDASVLFCFAYFHDESISLNACSYAPHAPRTVRLENEEEAGGWVAIQTYSRTQSSAIFHNDRCWLLACCVHYFRAAMRIDRAIHRRNEARTPLLGSCCCLVLVIDRSIVRHKLLSFCSVSSPRREHVS